MIRSRGTDSTVDPAYLADAPKVTTFIEELPSVTVEDNGKVLSVVDGAWNKAAPVEELPAVTAENNGEVLTVVEGVWDKAEPTKELPATTAEDNGKVLSVVEGEWNKSEPAKELPVVAAADNGDVLTVVDGAWAKADAPKGGYYYIDLAGTKPDYTANRSYNDIVAAVENGYIPVIRENNGMHSYNLYHLSMIPEENQTLGAIVTLEFSRLVVPQSGASVTQYTIYLSNDGSLTYLEFKHTNA